MATIEHPHLTSETEELQEENALLRMRLQSLTKKLEEQMQDNMVLQSTDFSYRSVFASMPINIYQKDMDGRYLFIHQVSQGATHALSEEDIGKTDFELVPKELALKYERDDQYVLSNEETIDLVESYIQSDGSTGFVHIIKSPLRDSEGNVIGTQGIYRDITQQHLAERQLLAQKETLDKIVTITSDFSYAIPFEFESEAMIESWLLQFHSLTGIRTPEDIARAGGWRALVNSHDPEILVKRHDLLMEEERIVTHFSLRSKDGQEHVIRDTASRMRKAGGITLLIGAAMDISSSTVFQLHRQE